MIRGQMEDVRSSQPLTYACHVYTLYFTSLRLRPTSLIFRIEHTHTTMFFPRRPAPLLQEQFREAQCHKAKSTCFRQSITFVTGLQLRKRYRPNLRAIQSCDLRSAKEQNHEYGNFSAIVHRASYLLRSADIQSAIPAQL